jgi:hypothetical protein
MKVGRNDPCPCGSGKKHKKCCLGKEGQAPRQDDASAPGTQEAPAPAESAHIQGVPTSPEAEEAAGSTRLGDGLSPSNGEVAPPAPDPRIEAFNARWEEFEREDYGGQIALFTQTLDDRELMDEEMAFEMLAAIYGKAIQHGERDRFDALISALRERRPDLYDHDAHHYLEWMIADAVATGQLDKVPAMATELAQRAGKDLDTAYHVVDLLAYHGQLSTLVDMMRTGWESVQQGKGLVSWAVPEFAARAVAYEVFDYVESTSSPDVSDPNLLERLAPYPDAEVDEIGRFIRGLTGETARAWTASDFRGLHKEKAASNLVELVMEFEGWLRRDEGVPYTKAELATRHIREYIRERAAGHLKSHEAAFGATPRPARRKRKGGRGRASNPLCPDRASLDYYLAGLLGFMNPQPHEAAATLELIPAWLRFLESRGLIDAATRANALRELSGLSSELAELLDKLSADPAPSRALREWPPEPAPLRGA